MPRFCQYSVKNTVVQGILWKISVYMEVRISLQVEKRKQAHNVQLIALRLSNDKAKR